MVEAVGGCCENASPRVPAEEFAPPLGPRASRPLPTYPTPQAVGRAGRPRSRVYRPSAAAHGRHDELVAPAGAALDLFAAAELKVGGQADLDFAEAPAAAGNRNALGLEPWIGPDESLLDLLRSDRQGRRQVDVLERNLYDRPGFANGFEIRAGRQARANAMAVPF